MHIIYPLFETSHLFFFQSCCCVCTLRYQNQNSHAVTGCGALHSQTWLHKQMHLQFTGSSSHLYPQSTFQFQHIYKTKTKSPSLVTLTVILLGLFFNLSITSHQYWNKLRGKTSIAIPPLLAPNKQNNFKACNISVTFLTQFTELLSVHRILASFPATYVTLIHSNTQVNILVTWV